MSADWSQWSEPQLKALVLLDFAVPIHATAMKWAKVRSNTIHSLECAGLVERIYLRDTPGPSYGMPFLRLTQKGQAVRRDWIRWNRSLLEKLGTLPPAMRAVAEARL